MNFDVIHLHCIHKASEKFYITTTKQIIQLGFRPMMFWKKGMLPINSHHSPQNILSNPVLGNYLLMALREISIIFFYPPVQETAESNIRIYFNSVPTALVRCIAVKHSFVFTNNVRRYHFLRYKLSPPDTFILREK